MIDVVSDALAATEQVEGGGARLLDACRRIASLEHELDFVPQVVLDTIVGVASELDDIPQEGDMALWEATALRAKIESRDRYLNEVGPVLSRRFRELRECLHAQLLKR